MIVTIDRALAVSIWDADDFRRFSVRIDFPMRGTGYVARKIEALLEVDTVEHAWVSVPALVQARGRQNDTAWIAESHKMNAYAGRAGWTRQDGTQVRGHIEWASDAGSPA